MGRCQKIQAPKRRTMSTIFEVEELQAKYNLPSRKIYELHARFQAAIKGEMHDSNVNVTILTALLRSCIEPNTTEPSFARFVEHYTLFSSNDKMPDKLLAIHKWLLLMAHKETPPGSSDLSPSDLRGILAPYTSDPALLTLQINDMMPTTESTGLSAPAFASYVTTRRPVPELATMLSLLPQTK
ncbi:hypothetical protein SPRG_13683 [Saprolegnia parasitica CBS 223.65]|uniref:Uncharacterized protein n=1 Tax=Saprolegnia parasitica (strain CBS 223.65) TaxID=695850 RepID=A0A067BWZ8_SAPPC|nr:hypothetical protein SPRG_13683 [Saprolegnia parasitica CBS 223.65]KDO21370.1 hypothetical protein SPRG_13683 [Saprolegnia parasitica CBS 223.65]|eukprot:XP_012207926.1 hypothetical protein SPRG_13683 [Saprolegnia parasitica CBS 223.65]